MARIRPSKPAAVFGAIFGLAILVYGVIEMGSRGGSFIWLWAVLGLGILGFNLWAAFAKRGATEVVDDDRTST